MNNTDYARVLKLVTSKIPEKKYLVMGSIATLSYTKKIGYVRQIHDIDIIMDKEQVIPVKKILLKRGFKLSTFIDKRMPFYKVLVKKAKSRYLRFTKDSIAVEILSTEFLYDGDTLKFDLYPNIWVKVPVKYLARSYFYNVSIKTLNVEVTWGIKKALNNTLGRIVKYKEAQRRDDLLALKNLVDLKSAKAQISHCRLGLGSWSFRVPSFLLR